MATSLTGYDAVAPLGSERTTRFPAAEQVLEDGRDYRALIATNKRRYRRRPPPGDTPATVNNFVFLALHRYYDGVVFHRVLEDFMAQTGDPTGTGRGGPGYRFDDEFVAGLSTTARACCRWRTRAPARTARSSSSPSRPRPGSTASTPSSAAWSRALEVLDA
jgi:hypothetical protein